MPSQFAEPRNVAYRVALKSDRHLITILEVQRSSKMKVRKDLKSMHGGILPTVEPNWCPVEKTRPKQATAFVENRGPVLRQPDRLPQEHIKGALA
jgi:hypothetical protein